MNDSNERQSPGASETGEMVFFQTADGQSRIECRFVDESIWLSQAQLAALYQVSVPTINEHLKNLYQQQELESEATIRKFRIVRREGEREVARNIESAITWRRLSLLATVSAPRGVRSSVVGRRRPCASIWSRAS